MPLPPPPPTATGRARAPGLLAWLPGIQVMRIYQRAWLPRDLAAGIVLTAVLVPTGMGYAAAAGLPPICGLYASVAPLLVYAVLGPSRILVLGPDSALAGLIAATVAPLAAGNPQQAVVLAGMLAMLSGALAVLGGLARVGFIANLLSTPIRLGYLNGIALTVLVGQLPTLLGLPSQGGSLADEAAGLARAIAHAQLHTAAAVGLACLLLVLALRRWRPAVPGVLIAVVGATAVNMTFDLAASTGMAVVGPLPEGLPALNVPWVAPHDIVALLPGALAIALVSLADMMVLARTLAKRSGHAVDIDQEIFALGVANIAAGLGRGFSVSGSSSRTPVAEAAGARTQLTGIVGAVCIVVLLTAAPHLLQDVPRAALAAVVIAACVSLADLPGTLRLWHLRRSEFAIAVVCLLGVALLGVIPGIFAAVGIALLSFVWRSWRPYDAVLGRVAGLRGYHDVTRHPEAQIIPGLVLFRWDAPLFFANAETFREHVLRAATGAATRTRWVVVAAEPVTDIDITAADMLADLDQELHALGMDLVFAEMKGPVKDQLKHYGLFARLGHENFHPTVGQAVDSYVAAFAQAQG